MHRHFWQEDCLVTVLFHLEWVWRQKDGSGVTLQWSPLFEFEFYYITGEESSNISEQAANMMKCSVKKILLTQAGGT